MGRIENLTWQQAIGGGTHIWERVLGDRKKVLSVGELLCDGATLRTSECSIGDRKDLLKHRNEPCCWQMTEAFNCGNAPLMWGLGSEAVSDVVFGGELCKTGRI